MGLDWVTPLSGQPSLLKPKQEVPGTTGSTELTIARLFRRWVSSVPKPRYSRGDPSSGGLGWGGGGRGADQVTKGTSCFQDQAPWQQAMGNPGPRQRWSPCPTASGAQAPAQPRSAVIGLEKLQSGQGSGKPMSPVENLLTYSLASQPFAEPQEAWCGWTVRLGRRRTSP